MRNRAVCLLLMTFVMANRAEAGPITLADVGDTLTIKFDGNVGGADVANLTSEIDFTLTAFDEIFNFVTFDVIVRNTSTAPLTDSRVSAFGFDANPDVLNGTSTSTEFSYVNTGGQFPNNFGNIEVCVIDNQNNCTGGGGSGIEMGQSSGIFQLTLNFADLADTLFLDNFGVRYQSISGLGYSGASGTGVGTDDNFPPPPPPPPPVVPEPSSMLLLGTGLAIGARKLRKMKKS